MTCRMAAGPGFRSWRQEGLGLVPHRRLSRGRDARELRFREGQGVLLVGEVKEVALVRDQADATLERLEGGVGQEQVEDLVPGGWMDQEVVVPVVPGNAEHDVTDPPRGEDGYRQAIHLVQDAVQLFGHLADTVFLLGPEVSAKEAAEDERQGQTAADPGAQGGLRGW